MSEIKVTFPNGEIIEATDVEENISPDFGTASHRFTVRIAGNDKGYTVQRLNDICANDNLSPLTVSTNGIQADVIGMNTVENISWRMSGNNNVGEFVIILSEKEEV